MITGGTGIGDWKDNRFRQLKRFSDLFHRFTVQIFFVAYELNTSKTETKIKLLNTTTIAEASQIVAKDYLANRTVKDMEELIGETEDKAIELKEDNG